MEYKEAKEKFISTWGSLGTLWGINKAMAQIQALLFISTKPLSMEDIMDELKISRGNTSMNLRQLMDWGIVTKELIPGERKEFFTTEKDVQELARIIAKERSRREIQPVVKILKEVSSILNFELGNFFFILSSIRFFILISFSINQNLLIKL